MADTQKFLKFKMGEHERLDGVAKSAGTIYVTTDEHAMYVDTSDNSRIRIQGSVLYFDSLTEFTNKVQPPFSTDVIYFIANEKAFVHWDGKEWTQLNITLNKAQEIIEAVNNNSKSIKENADNIEDNAGKIAENTGKIAENAGKIADNTGKINKNIEDITALKAIIGDGTDVGTGLIDRILVLEEEVSTAKEDIEGNSENINNLSDIIGNEVLADGSIKQNINTLKSNLNIAQSDINDLKPLTSKVSSIESTIGTETLTGGSIKQNINTLKSDLDDAKQNITDLNTTLERDYVLLQNYNNAINGINGQIGNDQTPDTMKYRITQLETRAKNVEDRAKSLEEKDLLIDKDILDLGNRIDDIVDTYVLESVHNTDIANINSRIDTVNNIIGDSLKEGTTLSSRITSLENTTEQIPRINEQISEINDNISNHNGRIETAESKISTMDGIIKGHAQSIATINGQITQLDNTIKANGNGILALNQTLETVKTLAEENEDNIGNLNEIIGTDNDPVTATTIKGKLKNLSDKMSDAEIYINSLKDKMPSVDIDINSLKERMGTAENDIKVINDDIKEINDNISELASKNEVDLIEQTLQKNIADHIKAANAMTYKGGVNKTTPLPTEGVKVGDTYVVTEIFDGYLPGDLLIAKGDETGEGESAVITSNLSWDRVITGYDASLLPSLKANENSIVLNDYADNYISSVQLTSDTANSVSITTNEDNNIINLSIEWGSF